METKFDNTKNTLCESKREDLKSIVPEICYYEYVVNDNYLGYLEAMTPEFLLKTNVIPLPLMLLLHKIRNITRKDA